MVRRAVVAGDAGAVEAKTTGWPWRPTSRLAWSKARVRNVEYTATTGRSPAMAMPAAAVTACCSAMPTSTKRSGKRSWNGSRPVEPGMAAVMATTSGRSSASLMSASVNACVYDGLPLARSRAGGGVEHAAVVQALLVVVLGGRVAPALLGEHVHDDRPVVLGRVAQRLLEPAMSWPSNGAGVADAEGLEEHRRLEHLAHAGRAPAMPQCEVVADDGHVAHELLEPGPLLHVLGLRRRRATSR